MCIPETEICPLNKIQLKFDNNCKSFMLEKYELFEEINNDIITKRYISAEQPKYITTENFIFDEETYNETFLKEIRCIIVVNIHIPS